MPEASFAIDCWADGTLLQGTVSTERVMSWLASHRCQPRLTRIRSSWQLGPERSRVVFECVVCSDHRDISVNTPFDLHRNPIHQYLEHGWSDELLDSRLGQWQERHRECLKGGSFEILRRVGNNRLSLVPVCPCHQTGPGTSWTITPNQAEAAQRKVALPAAQTGSGAPLDPQEPDSLAKLPSGERPNFVRTRDGSLYRLPRLTILLEYAGRRNISSGSKTIPIEDVWGELEPYDPPAEGPTWHDRLLGDD